MARWGRSRTAHSASPSTTRCPILPLVVNGTREALQADSWKMNVTEAEVRVLEPIPTEGMTKDDVPALRDRVRDLIMHELETMRS